MGLYRFSPIHAKEELLKAIRHIHVECHKLCKEAFGGYLPVAGNVSIFCHYDDEYETLLDVQQCMTSKDNSFNGKYFRFIEPMRIPEQAGIPAAEYTHLYVRQPDPYRHHVGDIDFYLEQFAYEKLRQEMRDGKKVECARIYPGGNHNMIELHSPDSDVLGYVNYKTMKEYI